MRFRYQSERIGSSVHFRPLVPIRISGGQGRFRAFRRAIVDTGATETVFPWHVPQLIGVTLQASSATSLVWRGTSYPLRFARAELELSTTAETWRWSATVGFTSAPLPYPLLGVAGFLEFFDATFLGADRVLELIRNRSFVPAG